MFIKSSRAFELFSVGARAAVRVFQIAEGVADVVSSDADFVSSERNTQCQYVVEKEGRGFEEDRLRGVHGGSGGSVSGTLLGHPAAGRIAVKYLGF